MLSLVDWIFCSQNSFNLFILLLIIIIIIIIIIITIIIIIIIIIIITVIIIVIIIIIIIIIYLFIYLINFFTCLFIFYLFIYLLILYLFQRQENIKRLIFHFLFNSLSLYVCSQYFHQSSLIIFNFTFSSVHWTQFKTLRSNGMVYSYPSVVLVSRLR